MAISFKKYRSQIEEAWKDVLDDKTSTNWCLFDYEGQSNELKVVSRGNGGLLELNEDLNSGKIMYAYVRFEDPKTRLVKFLLIHWQGEGAPALRKGTCANHIHEVTKILSGAHLTVNARNEDDIDLERLQKKLNAVGLMCNLKENNNINNNNFTRTCNNDNNYNRDVKKSEDLSSVVVGTNYKRVVPTKELNPTVMQDFWKKEEAEERNRLQHEKEQKHLQEIKLEQEQRAREEKEHLEREKQLEEKNLNKLHSAHKPIKTSPQPLSPEKTLTKNYKSVLTEAERMRQQRSKEARELIGSRVLTAKAIFTKNTTEGQLQTKLNSIIPPIKPVRNSITQRINAFNQSQTDSLINTSNNTNNNTHYQQLQQQGSSKPLIDGKLQQTHKLSNIENEIFKVNEVKTKVPIIITTNDRAEQKIISIIDEVESEKPIIEKKSQKNGINNGNTTERVEPVKPEIVNLNDNENDEENLIDGTGGIDDYYLDSNEVEQFSTIKRSPHSKTNSLQSPDEITTATATTKTALNLNSSTKRDNESNKNGAKNNIETEQKNKEEDKNEDEVIRTKVSVTVQQSQSQVHPSLGGKNNGFFDAVLERSDLNNIINEDDYICQDTLADIGLKARALYDYQAADDSEITFDPGDVITHIDQIDEGWWQGYGPDGSYGLFPANYVEIIQ